MDWLIVDGVKPWDGRYEFDLDGSPFTTREWGWIKRFSNYLPLTVDQGWRGGDPELFAAFAVIALHRAGRVTPADVSDLYDRFADAPFGGTIRLETDQAETGEGDAGPPAGNNGGSSSFSGDDSKTNSEMSPLPAGIPASATSASSPVGSPT